MRAGGQRGREGRSAPFSFDPPPAYTLCSPFAVRSNFQLQAKSPGGAGVGGGGVRAALEEGRPGRGGVTGGGGEENRLGAKGCCSSALLGYVAGGRRCRPAGRREWGKPSPAAQVRSSPRQSSASSSPFSTARRPAGLAWSRRLRTALPRRGCCLSPAALLRAAFSRGSGRCLQQRASSSCALDRLATIQAPPSPTLAGPEAGRRHGWKAGLLLAPAP